MNKGYIAGAALFGFTQWLMFRASWHEEQIEQAHEAIVWRACMTHSRQDLALLDRIDEYDGTSFFYKMFFAPDEDLVDMV